MSEKEIKSYDSKIITNELIEQLLASATCDIGTYMKVDKKSGRVSYKNYKELTREQRLNVETWDLDEAGNIISIKLYPKQKSIDLLAKFSLIGAFASGGDVKEKKWGDILDEISKEKKRRVKLIKGTGLL